MATVKLSITSQRRLDRKYDAAGRRAIAAALRAWIAADKTRGIRTIHVAIDDAAAMKPFKVAPVRGSLTPNKVKKALDALVARLAPEYVVLFGADDVVPHFRVANPSHSATDGDDDTEVLTDNPYACSRQFRSGRRSSYLVPDRVVGRIPDLPGSSDAGWITNYLQHAAGWTSRPASVYDADLLLANEAWRKGGEDSVTYLGRRTKQLLLAPPTNPSTPQLLARRGALLHMIKCHGGDHDSWFYGDGHGRQPAALKSPMLVGATMPDTVVGAMCCYGGKVFDPNAPVVAHPGEPPIPMVYLRQGAHGYLGSTTIAWVGPSVMMCADWVVTAFLKDVLSGASLGRAALGAKQDFLRWAQQEGQDPDTADEKTLLQFVLLGDPSIHPVASGSSPAARGAASIGGGAASIPMRMDATNRAQRRAARFALGEILRESLPERERAPKGRVPAAVLAAARATWKATDAGAKWGLQRADRVTTTTEVPELQPRAAASVSGAARRTASAVVTSQRYQYYWVSTRKGPTVRRIRMVIVHADAKGNVLRSRLVESS